MNNYVYAEYHDSNMELTVRSISAIDINDAKERLIYKFSQEFDIKSSEWEDFLDELWDEQGILLSTPEDLEIM